MKKVLIMGATSFIALELIERLLKIPYEIVAVIRPNSSNKSKIEHLKDKIRIVELEQNNYSDIWKEDGEYFDFCYYFTWSGIRGEDRNNEDLQRKNYLAFRSFIENANNKIKKFIGIGSWAEYGNLNQLMKEEMQVFPDSYYGKYKQKCYLCCKNLSETSDMSFVWARIFSIYGPGDYSNSLITDLCRKMLKNEDINLSACEHLWNYLYVSDAAEILVSLGINPRVHGVFNVASSKSQVLKDYIFEIKEIIQSESRLNFGVINSNNINMQPDRDKLRSEIGRYKEISFKDGIQRILNEIQKEDLI